MNATLGITQKMKNMALKFEIEHTFCFAGADIPDFPIWPPRHGG